MTTADSFAPETDIDLRLIWGVIVKYKWTIIGVPIAFAIAAKIAVGFVTPIFSASATVMIESEGANIVSIEEVYSVRRRNAQYFETQFAILRSRPLAEKVVEDLDVVTLAVAGGIEIGGTVAIHDIAIARHLHCATVAFVYPIIVTVLRPRSASHVHVTAG